LKGGRFLHLKITVNWFACARLRLGYLGHVTAPTHTGMARLSWPGW